MSKRRNTITLKGLEKKVYDGLERFVEAWIIEQEKQVDINSLLNETCRFNAKVAQRMDTSRALFFFLYLLFFLNPSSGFCKNSVPITLVYSYLYIYECVCV